MVQEFSGVHYPDEGEITVAKATLEKEFAGCRITETQTSYGGETLPALKLSYQGREQVIPKKFFVLSQMRGLLRRIERQHKGIAQSGEESGRLTTEEGIPKGDPGAER